MEGNDVNGLLVLFSESLPDCIKEHRNELLVLQRIHDSEYGPYNWLEKLKEFAKKHNLTFTPLNGIQSK